MKTETKQKPIAKLIKGDLDNFTGNAAFYELDPPLKDPNTKKTYRYVVVSATRAMWSGPETYIFPANKNGNVTSFAELPGSQRGTLKHEDALKGAGYEINA